MPEFSLARTLQEFDQFRVVSRDVVQATFTGGLFGMIAYAMLLLLIIAEVTSFLRTSYTTNIIVDENVDEVVPINFDISLYDLPCKYLKLSVWDKFGEEKMNNSDQVEYMPLDHTGNENGQVYSKEEISVLEKVDVMTDVTTEERKELEADWSSTDDHFHQNDFKTALAIHDYTLVNFFAEWCIHCRQFSVVWREAAAKVSEKMMFSDGDGRQTTVKFLRMNCVEFSEQCNKAQIMAFPTVRLYKRDGSLEPFQQKRTLDNIISFLTSSIKNSHMMIAHHHSMFNEGCRVRGFIEVPRVPGHFHLQAEAFGNVNVNPAITNVSHVVNHLSFGDMQAKERALGQSIPREFITHITPLNGKTFRVERFHEAPQHYLKVVSTFAHGQNSVFYQMTHTDRVRKLNKDMKQLAPQARFTYDFSPMSVVVRVKSKRWYEFLTSLFAILGGTYTIVVLCGSAVDSVSHTIKDAMGKEG